MAKTFLEAEWRKLIMVNYIVKPELLHSYLPHLTELDLWNNKCYVSLVGFMFINTKLKGFRIPFHTHFEEVNLRFYVKYLDQETWKRGVVFIKEIVPLPALTLVANTIYRENYETMAMSHVWHLADDLMVEYRWKKNRWNSIRVFAEREAIKIVDGSEEEFITEHYWGYTKLTDNRTSEYGVEHVRWEVYPVKDYAVEVDFAGVYGGDFAYLEQETPISVFLAEGSDIRVKDGRILK